MRTLNQLTQSHLSVLVLDKDSHNPIARMPIYAELSIVEESPPWKISGDDLGAIAESNDFFGSETVGAVLRSSLVQYIEENTFRGLDEEKRQSFLRRVVNLLQDEESLFPKSESEMKEIVDRAILKAMEEFEIAQSQTPGKKSIYSYPLGYLATDHVGYASFDLSRISELTRSQDNNFAAFARNGAQKGYTFFVYPMGKEGMRFDALEQGRFTNEAVFAKLSIEQPTLTRDLKILNLPSMQKPSLIDWYFSPGSFAAHPEFLVGDDGCERLFPAQITLQEFNLRQVVRIVGQSPISVPEGVKLAYIDDYRVTWHSLGHSLGEILYSLPLAPGESVKLAVIDWSWESATQRTEQTALTEEVLHQTHRDRTISETVKAGLRELQKGSSFMGGIAGSVGATGSIGFASGAAGIAGSLGGSTATSEGSRDLVAENVQRLSDSFSQASSAQREINSTVVVQARQEEKESIQTRTFTNYNHSHTLTILYYEVLRHFKVEVAWVRRRPAVLVKMSQEQLTRTFTANQLLGLRYLLDPFLLDPKLRDALDAASRIALGEEKLKRETNKWSASTQTIDPGAKTFVKLIAQFTTTSEDTSEPVFVVLVLHDGRRLEFQCDGAGDEGISPEFEKPLPFPINWNQIRGVEVRLQDINDGTDWEESNILITMVTAANERMSILADGTTRTLNDAGGSTGVLPTLQSPLPTTTNVGQKPQRADFISAEDDLAVQSLLAHFQANRSYYNRILMLAADSNAIAIEFESKAWSSGQFMVDHVDSTPLETFGSYIAYPFLDANDQLAEVDLKDLKKSAEKLITLPTRGVFAEGKLGHCNISEEIDDDRFWKWEEHPIPFEAPGINPVTPVTPQPQQTNTTPTAFPSSLVNIVNPSAAPDPTGLAAALTVLGTPNIFRDMSGRAEVADLLKKLSDNSVSIAEAANKAKEIQNKYGENLDKQQKDYDLGTYQATTGLVGKAIESGSQPNARKEDANATKAEVDAGVAQAQAAKEVPKSMRPSVQQAAANTIAGNPRKNKAIVFKAIGFDNQQLDGIFQLFVRDVASSKDVINGKKVPSYYDESVSFTTPEPILEARVMREGASLPLKVLDQDITLPAINIVPAKDSYTVGKSHSLINLTLKQASRDVSFKAKSTEAATNELMNKWGGELGVDKVVAAKIVADYENKKNITHGTEEEKSYSFNVPTQNYDLIFSSK